jgi:predicted kinase
VEKYYKISYDEFKWGFSQYKPDVHFDDVYSVLGAVTEAVCKLEYNIICDMGIWKEKREQLLSIARKYNYEVIEINLEAEYEVLLNRFVSRVEQAAADPTRRLANKKPERHRELFDIYQAEKNPNAITLRTDLLSEDEIAKQVLALA